MFNLIARIFAKCKPRLPKFVRQCDYDKPVYVPDEWLTWPGKERGEPRPGIIWAELGGVK